MCYDVAIIGAGVTGIVIAAALGVFGYVTMKKAQAAAEGVLRLMGASLSRVPGRCRRGSVRPRRR